jgi:hypothetical protein
MYFPQGPQPGAAEMSSASLAASLRTGPIRPILDRIVRSAADATGIPFMVLGIRYGQTYEFIATHGFPLTHYTDRVPTTLLAPSLFAREVEVDDLRKQTGWAALSIVPIAKSWRYGASVPVRLQQCLDDDGVLALSCADTKLRETRGSVLTILRGYADMISDLIWVSSQIERAAVTIDASGVIKAVLLAGLSRINIPVCIIDDDFRLVAFSESFARTVAKLGSDPLQTGQTLIGPWLTPALRQSVQESIATDIPKQWLPVTQLEWDRQLLDVFPFTFTELGKFAVLAFHDGAKAIAAAEQQAVFMVRDGPPVATPAGTDAVGPVSQFLLETLISAQRLYRRNDTTYIGVRKWRTAIKPHQIAALRALKTEPSDAFVSTVAAEMASAIRSVYGTVESCVVVPVPCGSSGPDCLACRLAAAVAAHLGIAMVEAFAPIATSRGNSHPRRNIRRPAMKLQRPVNQPVILIDDVATSGSHIDEGATLLRASAPQVWPVAWIAS